jgi:hypothetical protein
MTTSTQQKRQCLRPDAPSDAMQQQDGQNTHDADFDRPDVDPQRDVLASLRRQGGQGDVLSGRDAALEEGYGGNPVRSRQDQDQFEDSPRLGEERRSRNASDVGDVWAVRSCPGAGWDPEVN